MSDKNRNTGDCNTGNRNTGYCNTGNWNTGDCNTGNRNTGNWNTGDWNTGDWNTGYCNTGNRNTGDWNTGDWNTGHCNTGYFCTNDGPVTFFDQPCSLTREQASEAIPEIDLPCGVEWVPTATMTAEEKASFPQHETIGGFLRKHEKPLNESFPLVWARMSTTEKQRWRDLPNFDAEKFLTITGVDVRLEKSACESPASSEAPARIEIGGKWFRLVPESAE